MLLRTGTILLLAATLASSGCKMCCPSYDYCGPTRPDESNSECCGMARRGSLFSGWIEGGRTTPVDEADVIEKPVDAAPDEVPVPGKSTMPISRGDDRAA
jgi:hypothetical protein